MPLVHVTSGYAAMLPELTVVPNEASLNVEVQAILPKHRGCTVSLRPRSRNAMPTVEWVVLKFPNAVRAILVVVPGTSREDPVRVSFAVIVFANTEEITTVRTRWPSALQNHIVLSPFKAQPLTMKVNGSADIVHVEDIYELPNGSAGVCAVMPLADIKRLLPQDPTECSNRVLLVKRCHKLGSNGSATLKAHFDMMLGNQHTVEHVLMLPLKARASNLAGEITPPKTGFVVFKSAEDAMIARALGSLQIIGGEGPIEVETYDGL